MNGLPSIRQCEMDLDALAGAEPTPDALAHAVATGRALLRWVRYAGTPPVVEPTEKQRAASLGPAPRTVPMHLVRQSATVRQHSGVDLTKWVPARRFATMMGMEQDALRKAAHTGKLPKAGLLHRQRAYWPLAVVREQLAKHGKEWIDEPAADGH